MNWLRFAHPEFLHLLWGVPLLAMLLFYGVRQKKNALQRFHSNVNPVHLNRYKFQAGVFLLCYLLLAFAAARPQWGPKPERVAEQLDVMLALDISTSMLAEDGGASVRRLTQAKEAIFSMLGELEGDRVGLLYFAEAGFVVCPLTSDTATLREFLAAMTPETVSHSGTRIDRAIETATVRLDSEETDPVGASGQKALVLFSDGEDHGEGAVAAAQRAADADIRVYCIGVGSGIRAVPIPLPEEVSAYKRDTAGQLVLTRLDETRLQEIAEAGNGQYYPLRAGINGLTTELDRLEKRGFRVRSDGEYQERFQLFVGAALLLLICEMVYAVIYRRFRR